MWSTWGSWLFIAVRVYVIFADGEKKAKEGEPCLVGDPIWYPAPDSRHDFLYCHSETKIFTRQRCSSSFNGQPKMFDEHAQQCVVPSAQDEVNGFSNRTGGLYADASSLDMTIFGSGPRVGDHCRADSECPQNGRCDEKGSCQCRLGFLQVHKLCWQGLEPTSGPCIIDEQCSSTWPGAECYRGTCICPKGTAPVNTSGGVLCAEKDKCPRGGPYMMVGGSAVDPICQYCEEQGGLAKMASSNAFLYECVLGSGFSKAVCCPNKAMTCMQPQMSGNGQVNETRFVYDSVTDECREFEYYGGTMINDNVFHTRTQCENYCRRGCLRGNPELKNGQTVSCREDDQCQHGYGCYRRDGAESGSCCPSAENICNPFGGLGPLRDDKINDATSLVKEYDAGQEPDRAVAIYYPAVRYYYSASEKQCKTFLYRGVGGNFNNFLTMEQCQNFCAAAVCPSSQRAAVNARTNRWLRCQRDEQCPTDFSCQNGSCCGGGDGSGLKPKKAATEEVTGGFGTEFIEQACPRGTRIALRENGGLIFCDPSRPCSSDAFCRPSSTSVNGEGICCAGHILEFQPPKCPGNGSTPMLAGKYEPVPCSLGQESGCPAPYTCAYTSINATDGLCCTVPPEAVVCPGGMEITTVDDGHFHQRCSPLHLSSCPEGGACVFNEAYGVYYCCKQIERDCPEGRLPFLDPYTGRSLNCTSNCPHGFACLDSPGVSDRRTCCSEHPLVRHCLIGKALTNRAGLPYSCNPDSRCPPGYYCVSPSGSTDGNVCCPRADHVCSLSADFGSACTNGLESVTYYFDPSLRTCKPFLYRGCGGNDNRFVDSEQCEAFCHLSSVCRHGQPATSENGPTKRLRTDGTLACTDSGGCPEGYACTSTTYRDRSYCCPASEIVCKQPKSSGLPCDDTTRSVDDYQRVWYFDSGLKQCQPMTYWGCDGNANRFHTLGACEQFCHPTVCPASGRPLTIEGVRSGGESALVQCWRDADCAKEGYQCVAPVEATGGPSVCCPGPETICSSPIEKGEACGIPQIRYGYNRTSNTCESFTYLGCRGNENSFPNLDTCKKTCSVIMASLENPTSELVCSDSSKEELASAASPLKRCNHSDDCPPMHGCSQWRGAGYCCPTPKLKCLDRREQAGWRSGDQCSTTRALSSCPTNHSCTLTDDGTRRCCQDPDITQACPIGRRGGGQQQRRQPDTIVRCEESDEQCPPGHACIYNRQFGQFFCCWDYQPITSPRSLTPAVFGSGGGGRDRPEENPSPAGCPGGSTPYTDPYLRTIRVCSPYLGFSCPNNHQCLFNTVATRYQCCPIEEPAVNAKEWAFRLACPSGMKPYLQSDDRPIVCQPKSAAEIACPSPAVCQYSPLYWQFVCCMNDEPAGIEYVPTSPSCTTDSDCHPLPGKICRGGICVCSGLTLQHSCVDECPSGYIRTPDDRCQMPMFDYHYYRAMVRADRRRTRYYHHE